MATLRDLLIPHRRADKFNESVSANVNFFDSDIEAKADCLMRIGIALNGTAVLKAIIKRNTDSVTVEFNEGSSLNANSHYIFELPLKEADKLNLQIDTARTVLICTVDEVDFA